MDMELSQLDPVYLYDLIRYQKILQQRNRLLKEIFYQPKLADTLFAWDEQFLLYGKKIIIRRKQFLEELGDTVRKIHKEISGKKEILTLRYEPFCEENLLEDALKKKEETDIRLGMTSVGPHRDDISFLINKTDIRKYGSQGQQRTSALSLKLAEIEFVKKMIHDMPVLLLDDVLSELDSSRQNYLLNSIHDIQTMITCTGLDEFVKNRFYVDKIFFVKEGIVEEKTGGIGWEQN